MMNCVVVNSDQMYPKSRPRAVKRALEKLPTASKAVGCITGSVVAGMFAITSAGTVNCPSLALAVQTNSPTNPLGTAGEIEKPNMATTSFRPPPLQLTCKSWERGMIPSCGGWLVHTTVVGMVRDTEKGPTSAPPPPLSTV